MTDAPTITHDATHRRFVLAEDPELAELTYQRDDGRIVLTGTEVDEALEGRGVGSALVRAALDHAEAEELTIVSRCPFVTGWLERHPDRMAELDVEFQSSTS